jgi:hypothetical protein
MADPTSKLCAEWANDPGKQERVKHFMNKAALAIIGEGSTVDGHTERLAEAKEILAGTASKYEYAHSVSTNATIAAVIAAGNTVTDSDLEFAVNSVINDHAGYDPEP